MAKTQPHKWVLLADEMYYFNGFDAHTKKPKWVYSSRRGRMYPYNEWKMDKAKLEEMGFIVKTISVL